MNEDLKAGDRIIYNQKANVAYQGVTGTVKQITYWGNFLVDLDKETFKNVNAINDVIGEHFYILASVPFCFETPQDVLNWLESE